MLKALHTHRQPGEGGGWGSCSVYGMFNQIIMTAAGVCCAVTVKIEE